MKIKDLSGKRVGRLTVIGLSEKQSGRHLRWKCQCDCGNYLDVLGLNLSRAHTKSCGCYKLERTSEVKTIHGMSNSSLMNVWRNIHSRCYSPKNKSYKDYGARGIKVCPEWKEFIPFMEWAFKNGYEENLTIERINVDGDYEPSNCKWATIKEQANNKTNNVYITYKGETKTLPIWAEELDLPYKTLYSRLKYRKWSVEEAFERPIGNNGGTRRVLHNKGTH